MSRFSRLFSLILTVLLVVFFATLIVGCTDEEPPITIKSYTTDLTYTVGAEFAPTISVTKSDGSTATLTLLTNPAVEMPSKDEYIDILKLEENDEGALVYSKADEYVLDVLYCGETLTINFTIEEEE